MSAATPTLVLDAWRIAIFFDASRIFLVSASPSPVVQITAGVFVFTHSASRCRAAAGVEKSTRTSARFEREAVIATPDTPRPSSVP